MSLKQQNIVQSNLETAKNILGNVDSLLHEPPSVKCIVDSDGNYQMTSNAYNYIRAVHKKGWIYESILQHCSVFNERFGFGSEEFLSYVKQWSECFINLLKEGIPLSVLTQVSLEEMKIVTHFILPKPMSLLKDFERKSTNTLQQHTVTKATTLPRYSRYSRHSMEDEKLKLKDENKEKINSWLKSLVDDVCTCTKDVISKLILELLMIKGRWEEPFKIDGLKFNTDDFNLEYVINKDCSFSKIYLGIALPLDHILFDVIHAHKKMKVILVDTDFYGDNLPGTECVNFHQVIEANDHYEDPFNNFDIADRLVELDVKLVILRGNVTETTKLQLQQHNIIILTCNYKKLLQISQMCSCEIAFSWDEIKASEIRTMQLELISRNDNFETTGKAFKYRNDTSTFLLLTYESSFKPYYSIFICARTSDLLNLLSEDLSSNLKRIEAIFKYKTIIYRSKATAEVIACFDATTLATNDHSFVPVSKCWIRQDCEIFRQIVRKELNLMFQAHRKKFPHYVNVTVTSEYLIDLWNESLKCIVDLINTREFSSNIYIE